MEKLYEMSIDVPNGGRRALQSCKDFNKTKYPNLLKKSKIK